MQGALWLGGTAGRGLVWRLGQADGDDGGRRERRSLGTVVPVVVDVDRSGDAADYEGDPSSNQIEPGGGRGLKVREMERRR